MSKGQDIFGLENKWTPLKDWVLGRKPKPSLSLAQTVTSTFQEKWLELFGTWFELFAATSRVVFSSHKIGDLAARTLNRLSSLRKTCCLRNSEIAPGENDIARFDYVHARLAEASYLPRSRC